jgi:hypothetical protein
LPSILCFFSELFVANLVDFQGKVAQIVKAIGLAFDDFDHFVDPVQFAGVDAVIAVVLDSVAMPLQHFGKFVHSTVIDRSSQLTP